MIIKFSQPAPLDSRFARDAFDRSIGQRVALTISGQRHPDAMELLSATVAKDGSAVVFEAALLDEFAQYLRHGMLDGLSIGPTE